MSWHQNPTDFSDQDRKVTGKKLKHNFAHFKAIPTRPGNGRRFKNVDSNKLSVVFVILLFFISKSQSFTEIWRMRTDKKG